MRKMLPVLLFLLAAAAAHAQKKEPVYNKALADSLGADDYGMKMYQFVVLKTGPTQIADKDSVSRIFKSHMSNINRLVKEGYLIVAGPFGKNDKQYRGLFIFKAGNKEAAAQLLQTDPAIKSGILAYEIFDWYGSAALPMYLPFSEVVAKKDI